MKPTSDGTDIGAFEGEVPCILECPDDITVTTIRASAARSSITQSLPETSCGTVTCDHPSGSFFPVGDTVVTCTSSAGPSCSFTVTVEDTEGPVITTGGPIHVVAA